VKPVEMQEGRSNHHVSQIDRANGDGGNGQCNNRRSQNIIVDSTGLLELSGWVHEAVVACYRHLVMISGKKMARQVMLSVVTEIMDECDGMAQDDKSAEVFLEN